MDEPWKYGCAYCHCTINDPETMVNIPYYGSTPAMTVRHFCCGAHASAYAKDGPLPDREQQTQAGSLSADKMTLIDLASEPSHSAKIYVVTCPECKAKTWARYIATGPIGGVEPVVCECGYAILSESEGDPVPADKESGDTCG